MNYLLSSNIINIDNGVEIGLTGAKIYNSLFYHLFLIPSTETKRYLINNFPKTYSNILIDHSIKYFDKGIDYENNIIDEEVFLKYNDIDTYNV